jgi:hypothetical protein
VNTFDADNNALQDQLNNYDEIINNLSNIVIPQLQTDIEGKAGTSYFAISSRGGQQANTPL